MNTKFFGLFLLSLLIIGLGVHADTVSTCINSTTAEVNTTQIITSGGSSTTISVADRQQCTNGCSTTMNACRPDLFYQSLFLFGIIAITLILAYLAYGISDRIKQLDLLVIIIIAAFPTTLAALTDVFTGYYQTMLFIVGVAIAGVLLYYESQSDDED